jgi:hypothetical protein
MNYILAQSLCGRNEIKSRSRGVDKSRVKRLISKIEAVALNRDGGLTAIDLCFLPSGLCLLPSAFYLLLSGAMPRAYCPLAQTSNPSVSKPSCWFTLRICSR